jgi:16S rRNA G966 N2-methylase RsmD
MHSCGFLWTYFPHWIDVKYNNQKTIKELWQDDNKLKELIRKTYEYENKFGNGFISENRLRQNSKVYLSKQSVSNFRPTVAKFIYNKFGNNGVVWDMSCGWGGRLLGFLSSNCKSYIGTEPSKKTFEGLINIKNDFNIKEVLLYNIGSEEYLPKENSLDLCFTSPPYFDTEKYSDEKTQSYIKFNSKNTWLNDFYKKTIINCFKGLKKDAYMIINISNTPKYKWLEEETVKISNEIGFTLIDIFKLELSSISGKGQKYEPVFIFQK